MPQIMTTCPYCGCGCGLYLCTDESGRVTGVDPSSSHPVSRGRLCVKGWHAHEVALSPRRLHSPLIRRNGRLAEAEWEEALGMVAEKLGAVKGHDVGLLGSPRHTNEENYLLAKWARCCLQTNNVDFAARVEALPTLFDLPEHRHLTLAGASLEDIDRADLIVLWQTDPALDHPAGVGARLLRAVERGVPLIEVATRSGQIGKLAGVHLAPLPGTDIALAAGLLRAVLAAKGAVEAEDLAAAVSCWTPERTEEVAGVAAAATQQAAQAIAGADRPLVLCTRGASCNPVGPDLLSALFMFGRFGPEEAPNWSPYLWLNSACNFQGARDVGVVPYLLPGYEAISDRGARERFERAWGCQLPPDAGRPAWEMLGQVKALFVMGDDPITTLPDPATARHALRSLDFLVVQDLFLTPTAELAHVVLPGVSFAEKDGTFTNTERRVQRVRRAIEPLGQGRCEWQVICELSTRMGKPLHYHSPAEVLAEIAGLVSSYSGLSFEQLDSDWGVRLKSREASPAASGSGAGSGAPFSSAEESLPAEDGQFPLVMALDYSLGQWPSDSMVANAIGLRRAQRADGSSATLGRVLINAEEARGLELRDGARVRVRSRTGEVEAPIQLSQQVRPGVMVVPMTMREQVAGVMPARMDPESGVPSVHPVRVCIEKL